MDTATFGQSNWILIQICHGTILRTFSSAAPFNPEHMHIWTSHYIVIIFIQAIHNSEFNRWKNWKSYFIIHKSPRQWFNLCKDDSILVVPHSHCTNLTVMGIKQLWEGERPAMANQKHVSIGSGTNKIQTQ